MKNLTPLRRKISYWDNIVSNKNLAPKASLQAVRPNVLQRFTVYSRHVNPNTLELIPASPFLRPLKGLLADCYLPSGQLSVLKTRILEKQSDLLRGECQYCNIGEPDTFDHYLPQNYFSEYSALSINLFPCCSRCNTEKGREWLLLGVRTVINFYYDVLPTTSYLMCRIVYRKNVPKAIFSINETVIPLNIRQLIVNHFKTLDLTARYRKRSNSEIIDVFNSITPQAGRRSRAQIQNDLLVEATNMKNSKGQNYWRAVIKIALSNSIPFLISAGY